MSEYIWWRGTARQSAAPLAFIAASLVLLLRSRLCASGCISKVYLRKSLPTQTLTRYGEKLLSVLASDRTPHTSCRIMPEAKAQNENAPKHAAVTTSGRPSLSSQPHPLSDNQSPSRRAYDYDPWRRGRSNPDFENTDALPVPLSRTFRVLSRMVVWVLSVTNISLNCALRRVDVLVRPRVAKDAVRITWKCVSVHVYGCDVPAYDFSLS